MSFEDKTLTCRDCSGQFVFTAGEQEFYESKGFGNTPTRCADCRAQFKAANRGHRGPREMHQTTCSGCGKEASVPFVPRGDKPVYCSECFQSQRPAASSRW
jgi:CxxC-x17-CxxC domain-containing protein